MVTLFRQGKFLTLRYSWGFFPDEPKMIAEWELAVVLDLTAKWSDKPTHIAINGNFDELIKL